MTCINLLPWRQERREVLTQQFFTLLGGVALVTVLAVILVHMIFVHRLEQQQFINNLLQQEIITINQRIKKIETLRIKKKSFLHA